MKLAYLKKLLTGKMLLDVRRVSKVFLFQRVTHAVVRTQRCTVIFPAYPVTAFEFLCQQASREGKKFKERPCGQKMQLRFLGLLPD